MPFTFTMPKLSPTMETGTIAKWHKKEGDHVEADEVLLEIDTDKATVEHNALDAGWLRKIIVQDGGEAAVNQPLAIFSENKDDNIADYIPEGVKAEKSAEPTITQQAVAPTTNGKPGERVKASPLARKLAQELGMDLMTVQGTGPGGRVMSRDLTKGQEPSAVPAGTFEEEALTPMRRVIAQRLQQAKTTIPHFYVRQSVDATGLVTLRDQLAKGDLKVTYNDMVVRACALVLRDHLEVNSGFNDDNQTLVRYKSVDICVAVSIEGGLITPIVASADRKSLIDISQEVKFLAKRAKENKLTSKEFKGGSFTISNLGMYGIDDFVAVINPPQAAILAVGGVLDVPVVREGIVVPGKVMNITLSADHRVIDGTIAAQFLRRVKHFLENPALLLV